jgi:hypothetical protein
VSDQFASPASDETPISPAVAPAPKRKDGGSLTSLLVIAALVAVGGIAFAGGRLTAPTGATGNGFPNGTGFPNGFPNGSFTPNGGGFANRGLGGTILRGEVTAVSRDSITIRLDSGTSVTVPLDAQTTYHESTAGSATDVTVGSQVAVEPGQIDFQPGASFAPGASPDNINFGPAQDVTVVGD